MFTGLIEWQGSVLSIHGDDTMKNLTIAAPDALTGRLKEGCSIAVDGICLSVVDRSRSEFSVQVIRETLARTTIGEWQPGRFVNLELPVTPSSFLGGHWVQGHIDGTTDLVRIDELGETCVHTYRTQPSWVPYMVGKGSIAVNGVSLTLAHVSPTEFHIALIPMTLTKTNLGRLQPGDRVNIEVDVMAKTIYHLAAPYLEKIRREDKRGATGSELHDD